MAREITLISQSTSTHYLLFGMSEEELVSFKMQLWIEKTGAQAVDWVQAMSLGFISFMGGELWIHNSDEVPRCNLYGEEKDCIVGVISNEDPTKVKLFDSLGIHSDGEWEITEIIIPATLNYPNGMVSKIPKERFKKRDGVLRAEFLRNMKTNQSTISVIDALNGEPMRGYECYMVLKNVNNPDGNQVKLFKVSVSTSSSRV
jgi:hypothetical protein